MIEAHERDCGEICYGRKHPGLWQETGGISAEQALRLPAFRLLCVFLKKFSP